MKKFIYIFIALLSIAACKKPGKEINNNEKEKEKDPDKIELISSGVITVGPGNSTVEIRFEANGDWTAALSNAEDTWLSINPQSGKKDVKFLTVTVQENASYDDRSGAVVLTCGEASAQVRIDQRFKGALIVSEPAASVEPTGGSFNVTVSSNVTVEVVIPADAGWISNTTTKGLTDHSYNFTVEENRSGKTRSASISFKCDAEGLTEIVTVTQESMTIDQIYSEYGLYSTGMNYVYNKETQQILVRTEDGKHKFFIIEPASDKFICVEFDNTATLGSTVSLKVIQNFIQGPSIMESVPAKVVAIKDGRFWMQLSNDPQQILVVK